MQVKGEVFLHISQTCETKQIFITWCEEWKSGCLVVRGKQNAHVQGVSGCLLIGVIWRKGYGERQKVRFL
jgi:hypothetical protein